jgi:hypothetical protein
MTQSGHQIRTFTWVAFDDMPITATGARWLGKKQGSRILTMLGSIVLKAQQWIE